MLQLTYLLLLLGIARLTSGAASNSDQDCLGIAARFATTVSNGPVVNILPSTGVNVTYAQLRSVSCPSTIVNGACVFQKKLAVTCINAYPVRIRVQSNGLARRCASVSLNVQLSERNVDFEVNFNPDVSVNSPNQAPTTAAALNAIVCNISDQSTVPAASAMTFSSGSVPVNALTGVVDQCLSHLTGGTEYH